ncbi:hypothetical protein GCM10028819_33190 [Spirosoma humi]
MALDGTSIKNDIDNDLANKGYRGVRVTGVITALKRVIDWVTGAVNGNLSTWLRIGDNQPGGANTDNVYHMGKLVVGTTVDDGSGAVLQAPNANFATLNGLPAGRAQTITSVAETSLPATRYYPFAELAAPTGGTFDFLTVEMVCKPWDSTAGEPQIIKAYFANRGGFTYYYTVTGGTIGAGLVAVRHPDNRILFYAYADNGFKLISVKVMDMAQATIYPTFGAPLSGIPANTTLVFNSTQPVNYPPKMELGKSLTSFPLPNSDGFYPVPFTTPGVAKLTIGGNYSAGSSEVSLMNANTLGGGFSFWQQLTASTKRLLASLNGNGWLGLGTLLPSERLHVDGNIFMNGVLKFPATILAKKINLYENGSNNDHQFYGFGILASTLKYQVNSSADRHAFYAGQDPATSKHLMTIKGDGTTGIGTETPTAALHVKGSTGYQQLKLETSYVPTGPTDPNGEAGTVCWGEDYFYWKTSTNPHRWRRAASSGW